MSQSRSDRSEELQAQQRCWSIVCGTVLGDDRAVTARSFVLPFLCHPSVEFDMSHSQASGFPFVQMWRGHARLAIVRKLTSLEKRSEAVALKALFLCCHRSPSLHPAFLTPGNSPNQLACQHLWSLASLITWTSCSTGNSTATSSTHRNGTYLPPSSLNAEPESVATLLISQWCDMCCELRTKSSTSPERGMSHK